MDISRSCAGDETIGGFPRQDGGESGGRGRRPGGRTGLMRAWMGSYCVNAVTAAGLGLSSSIDLVRTARRAGGRGAARETAGCLFLFYGSLRLPFVIGSVLTHRDADRLERTSSFCSLHWAVGRRAGCPWSVNARDGARSLWWNAGGRTHSSHSRRPCVEGRRRQK